MQPADLIILNARIHTVDRARPKAEAIAIRGETIELVGSNSEVQQLAGPSTRTITAGGRRIVPGFNDAHVHFTRGAEEILGVDLRPARNADDLAARLQRHVAELPYGQWVTGGFWDHESWPSRMPPTRSIIDNAAPHHPVFIQRLDGHVAVANSLAMELAGITKEIESPFGGTIVRDDRGEPNGLFKDNAMQLVSRAIPADSLDDTLTKIRAALAHAASLGVTTIQDMTASSTELRAYQTLRNKGELTARIYSIQNRDPRELRDAGIGTGFGDDWLRIGGIKIFSDGSMGAGTAAFFEPYTDDPATSGLLIYSAEELRQRVFDADAAGFQVIVHAIGDRANTLVLDTVEQLVAERGSADRRFRIEHAQVVRPSDKQRFAKLGVIASVQPSHCIDDMRWAEGRIGRARCANAYNVRSFAAAGVKVAFGTDWFVEPLNPMIGLYAALTRQFPNGTPPDGWFAEERITLAEAVEYYTVGSAYAEFADHRKGSLTPGKLADLVMLSHDIFAIPSREILDTRPVMTIVGGRIVHDATARGESN
jgi:predicted amidohydrolase YtcJ